MQLQRLTGVGNRVIAVTALKLKIGDHSQGESGVSRNRPIGPNSLPLKILPVSY